MKQQFIEKFETDFDLLELYSKAITRAHGYSHPEAFQVRELFETISEKTREAEFDLEAEFAQLRTITNNYQVPDDVCETYATVYKKLAQLDNIYFKN